MISDCNVEKFSLRQYHLKRKVLLKYCNVYELNTNIQLSGSFLLRKPLLTVQYAVLTSVLVMVE